MVKAKEKKVLTLEDKPKEKKQGKRGQLPTAADQGIDIIDSASVSVMSITTFHIITGKSKETIKQRINVLMPVFEGQGPTGGRFYDPKKALPLIYERDFLDARTGSDAPEGRKNDPKFRREMAQAEKAEIELGEIKKEFVRVDDIGEQIAEEYALLRQRLLSIPTRCAKRILLVANESEALDLLRTEINLALNELNADAEGKLKALEKNVKINSSDDE